MPEEFASAQEWLTTAEVATRLRVHQRTVQRWVTSGQLRATRVGPKVQRIRVKDLDAFLRENQHDATERSE